MGFPIARDEIYTPPADTLLWDLVAVDPFFL